MEKNSLDSPLHRESDGPLQQRLSDSLPSIAFEHRHPADFRFASPNDDPYGSNAFPPNSGQKMDRDSVIFVELELFWDPLLPDENPQTDRSSLVELFRRKELFNDDL